MSQQDRVVITGCGVVTPLADEPQALFDALCAGRSALRPLTLFAAAGGGRRRAAELTDFDPRRDLGKVNVRPLDRVGRLATVAARRALAASGWTDERRAEHDVALVLGTMFGSVRTVTGFDHRALTAGPSYVKPLDFANTVINAAAGQTAIWHGLRGVSSTLAGGPTAGLQAIGYAADLVRSGRAGAVLAGGVEELCAESFLAFDRHGLLGDAANGSRSGPVPFDARRAGFALGEGAALLMVESARLAAARDAPVLAVVRGHGSAFDPRRGDDEGSAARALARAIAAALADAGLEAGDVDAVSASANGSVSGDRREALGLLAAFGDGARELPITAVKSMLGETLGAAGALQTLALVEALARGVLPGIAGLGSLDDDLPLAGARAASRRLDMARGLVTTTGFDGNVHALIVERPAP